MSYTIYRDNAFNGIRELIGMAESAMEAAEICEQDRRENSEYAQYLSYDIIGKDKSHENMDKHA